VSDLEPYRRKQHDIEYAKHVLRGEEDQNKSAESAIVPVRGSPDGPRQDPDQKDAGQESDGRVRPAPPDEPSARGREIRRKRGAE
jgi:hypothetical protein